MFYGALVTSTIISAVGAIILAWVLGENNYGVYAVVLTAPNLIGLFRDLSINLAVPRYTALLTSENKKSYIRNILLPGLILKTAYRFNTFAYLFLLSEYLATDVFQRPFIVPLIQIVSIMILAQGLVNTVTAVVIGVEKMRLNSIMIVSQSVIKTVLSPLLVVLGLSTYDPILGFTTGILARRINWANSCLGNIQKSARLNNRVRPEKKHGCTASFCFSCLLVILLLDLCRNFMLLF